MVLTDQKQDNGNCRRIMNHEDGQYLDDLRDDKFGLHDQVFDDHVHSTFEYLLF